MLHETTRPINEMIRDDTSGKIFMRRMQSNEVYGMTLEEMKGGARPILEISFSWNTLNDYSRYSLPTVFVSS